MELLGELALIAASLIIAPLTAILVAWIVLVMLVVAGLVVTRRW